MNHDKYITLSPKKSNFGKNIFVKKKNMYKRERYV